MFPTLQKRYLSSLIDGVVLLFTAVAGTIAYQGENQTLHLVRVFVLICIIVSYEPILTSQLCTVGQRVMGIRVRRYADPTRKMSIARAYLRTSMKVFLGVYSFFAMGFNKQRRAAHDFIAGSVVLEVSGPSQGRAGPARDRERLRTED